MKNNSIGLHINLSNFNLTKTKNLLKSLKINIIQICFCEIPNLNNNKINKLTKFIKKNNLYLYVHSNYSINLAQNWNNNSFHINTILNELYNCNTIGVQGYILHIGNKMSLSTKTAIDNIVSSINYIHNKTFNYNVQLILETSSGQGTELCSDLHDFCDLYKQIGLYERVKICLDTCHMFAAGYDISSFSKINNLLNLTNKLFQDNIVLIHLNDSKNKLGSKIDRHTNNGFIGKKNLKYFYNYFKLKNVPCILETEFSNFYHKLS